MPALACMNCNPHAHSSTARAAVPVVNSNIRGARIDTGRMVITSIEKNATNMAWLDTYLSVRCPAGLRLLRSSPCPVSTG